LKDPVFLLLCSSSPPFALRRPSLLPSPSPPRRPPQIRSLWGNPSRRTGFSFPASCPIFRPALVRSGRHLSRHRRRPTLVPFCTLPFKPLTLPHLPFIATTAFLHIHSFSFSLFFCLFFSSIPTPFFQPLSSLLSTTSWQHSTISFIHENDSRYSFCRFIAYRYQ